MAPTSSPTISPRREPVLSDIDFITTATDKILRTVAASPHRPHELRFTSHRQDITVSLVLQPPAANGANWGWCSRAFNACWGWCSWVLREHKGFLMILPVVVYLCVVVLVVGLFIRFAVYLVVPER